MITYAPYFISTVIMVSIIIVNLTPQVGMISKLFEMMGVTNTNFMGMPDLFQIYLCLVRCVASTPDAGDHLYRCARRSKSELYRSARVDGASNPEDPQD